MPTVGIPPWATSAKHQLRHIDESDHKTKDGTLKDARGIRKIVPFETHAPKYAEMLHALFAKQTP